MNKKNNSIKSCTICGANNVELKTITNWTKRYYEKKMDFIICNECKFVHAPSNQHSYRGGAAFGKTSQPNTSTRVGNDRRPGREFFMAKTAVEILKRNEMKSLFYGSGLSVDYKWAKSLEGITEVKITDIENYQNSDYFIPLSEPRAFDIIICCEVIEHFDNPQKDFKTMLSFLKPNGILVMSTNISDGKRLEILEYPFVPGHINYYSGAALINLSNQLGYNCDFRVPECAMGTAGSRKRYVFIYKDTAVQDGIHEFFAAHVMAYSESDTQEKKTTNRKTIIKSWLLSLFKK